MTIHALYDDEINALVVCDHILFYCSDPLSDTEAELIPQRIFIKTGNELEKEIKHNKLTFRISKLYMTPVGMIDEDGIEWERLDYVLERLAIKKPHLVEEENKK